MVQEPLSKPQRAGVVLNPDEQESAEDGATVADEQRAG
jgi:hypothetical protein